MKAYLGILKLTLIVCILNCNPLNANVIYSATSGIWSMPSVWIGGVVPGSYDSIIISAGHMVHYNNNILIASGGSITINGSLYCIADTFKSECGGLLINNGTLTGYSIEVTDGINNGVIVTPNFSYQPCGSGFIVGNVINSTSCIPTGVDAISFYKKIDVFPNPFDQELNISSDLNEDLKIIIYDINSRIVYTKSFYKRIKISTMEFPEGIYYFELNSETGHISQMLIKQIRN